MDQKCTNTKELDENLTWLTRKTEDPRSNKGNLTFPSHTVNVIELQSNKKWQTPISTSTPPFQAYSPFLVKNFIPPSDSIFGRSEPCPPLIRAGGGSNYEIYFEGILPVYLKYIQSSKNKQKQSNNPTSKTFLKLLKNFH